MHLQRIRHRLLQHLYRPRLRKPLIPSEAFTKLDELNSEIEKKITPLWRGKEDK